MSSTFAGRLELAKDQYWTPPEGERDSWRAFSRAMQRRDVPGARYASIIDYRKSKTIPGLPWIEAAADELGVQKKWLAFGEGQPTPLEEEWSVERTEPTERERFRQEVQEEHPELAHLPQKAQELFFSVVESYVVTAPDAESITDEETRTQALELAGDLLFLLRLPQKLGGWGFHNVGTAPGQLTESYALTMLSTLRGYMRPARDGDPLQMAGVSLIRKARKHIEGIEAQRNKEAQGVVGDQETLISRREGEQE